MKQLLQLPVDIGFLFHFTQHCQAEEWSLENIFVIRLDHALLGNSKFECR